jgi:hypothetical protein
MRSLLVALVLTAAAAPSGGCGTRTYLVAEAPPPARQEAAGYKPGYVWIQGNYVRSNGRWVWSPGRYERERAGYVWFEGRWDRRPQGYVWIEGGWRKQPGVVVRRR